MDPRSPTTVVVVEDHPEFRDALARAVTAAPDMDLLAVCKDLPAAIEQLERICPDVLLVDLGLPTGSGLTAIRMARARHGAHCASAVLTVTGNEEHLLTAMTAGAKGFLFKSDHERDWCETIRLLACGQSPLHPPLAQSLLDRASGTGGNWPDAPRGEWLAAAFVFDELTLRLLRHIAAGYTVAETAARLGLAPQDAGVKLRALYDRFARPVPALSPRELQLMQLLNKGHTFKQCAELMGISESTVKTHSARAYDKLGASNLQSALYEARLAGLIY